MTIKEKIAGNLVKGGLVAMLLGYCTGGAGLIALANTLVAMLLGYCTGGAGLIALANTETKLEIIREINIKAPQLKLDASKYEIQKRIYENFLLYYCTGITVAGICGMIAGTTLDKYKKKQ